MPCDSYLTDNRVLKISVMISADVLQGYFQLLVLYPSAKDTVPGELKAAEEVALFKAAGYCGTQFATGIWFRSRNTYNPTIV